LSNSLISKAFQLFSTDAPKHSEAWMQLIQNLSQASNLDQKTHALAYLSVLAVLRLESGVPFHIKHAKKLGATREEIISAILVGLPAAGHVVTQALPIALETYDSEQ
jgi:alkylhydroperoxidase/carboxymuconolactone decarboxylase family protein YurZ